MSRQAMRELRHDAKFGGYHMGEMMGALRACRRAQQEIDEQTITAYGKPSSPIAPSDRTEHIFVNNRFWWKK